MNLSIFNFKDILKSVLYIFMIFVTAFVFSYFILWYLDSNKTGFFNGFFPKQPNNINPETQILVLGNSTTGDGIKISLFDKKTENFSSGGGDFVSMNAILKSALQKPNNLKFIVIAFDNLMFFVDGIGSRKGDFRFLTKSGVDWRDIPNVNFRKKIRYVLQYQWPIFSYLLKGPKLSGEELINEFSNQTASEQKNRFMLKVDQGDIKVNKYENAHKKMKNVEANKKALVEIIKVTQANDIKIIFVRMPLSVSYKLGMSKWWQETFHNFLTYVKNLYRQNDFLFFDFSQLDLENLYFSDPNHLNEKGAEFITEKLNNIIREIESK